MLKNIKIAIYALHKKSYLCRQNSCVCTYAGVRGSKYFVNI